VPHIGDEPGDRGHGVGLLEGPVDDLHHPIIILREAVVARLELLRGHVLRPHDNRAARELRVVDTDDPPFPLKFPIELSPRISPLLDGQRMSFGRLAPFDQAKSRTRAAVEGDLKPGDVERMDARAGVGLKFNMALYSPSLSYLLPFDPVRLNNEAWSTPGFPSASKLEPIPIRYRILNPEH